MLTTVDVRHAQIVTPRDMSDEQLATADELITDTIRLFWTQGQRDGLTLLYHHRSAMREESKRRMAQAHALSRKG